MISLVQNPDIVAAVAALAQRPALVIGFAAETTELIAHAREKRHRKGLDYIVANDVSDPETTFEMQPGNVSFITALKKSPVWKAKLTAYWSSASDDDATVAPLENAQHLIKEKGPRKTL